MKKQNIFSTIIAIVLFMSGGTYIYNQYNNDYIFNWSFTDQDEKIDILNVPDYTHQEYVEINNNIPYLYLDAFNKCKKGSIWKESVQRYEMNLLKNIVN